MKKLIPASIFLFLFLSRAQSQNTFEISYGTTSHDVGSSVKETFDRKFVVAGSTYSSPTGDGDIYLALIDSIGNVLWTKSYGGIMDESGKVCYSDRAIQVL